MTRDNPKLVDVARRAGVSTATVSRVLSAPDQVSDEMRQRVEQAVRELRYVPHGAARALRSRRTRAIGAIVPTLSNAIFANYTQALQKTLETLEYRLLLACNEYDPRSEESLVAPLIEHGIDGLVLVGRDHSAQLFNEIEQHRLPYVLTWTCSDATDRPCIGFRNKESAMRIVNHLLDLRHREFAMIAGIAGGNDRARDRIEGFQSALEARGIPLAPGRLLERPYSLAAGREAMRRLMQADPRPTAVICGNDVLAIGALAQCHEMNIAVPREVSVTGFDDMEMAAITVPPLTTVHVPAETLGRLAAEYIVGKVEGTDIDMPCELKAELVLRGTTGPAP